MAKYSKEASKKVEKTMHEMQDGKLKSGGSGKKVTNPKQAIAIGLSEAREDGAKAPKKKEASPSKSSSKSDSSSKKADSRAGSKKPTKKSAK